MERAKLDIWVGIFVIMGIIAMFGLATKVGNLTSNSIKETYQVFANFENIGGLKPRAAVKAAGVVVGRVDSIVFDTEAYHAVVKIKVDTRYIFPKDTFANIYTAGLLGEQYIGLEAGGDLENLEDGDLITQTQDAVVLEKLISQFLYKEASEED
jgi:phospholipid/cholesterol/gamma-HCH transport system substrate-binding protein